MHLRIVRSQTRGMRMAALALVLGACTTTAPVISPAPSPSPTSVAQPAITPSTTPTEAAAPTPTPIAPSARPIPAGAEPFDLLTLRWGDTARLWLIDPRLQRSPELIAKWSAAFEVGATSSASADRSRVVISAVAASGAAALYVIETHTGTVRALVEDPAADLLGPVIDGRGITVAYTRRGRGPTSTRDGIWVALVDGGVPRRILDSARGAAQAWGWSADGAWLAYTPVGFLHVAIPQPVHIVSADGTQRADTGLVGAVDWHPTSPRLLITTSASPSQGGASVVSSYDAPSGRIATLYRPPVAGAWLGRARWDSDGGRFAVTEHDPSRAETEVVVVRIGGADERPAKAAFVVDAFWSSGRLIALIGGDDSAVGILDVATGRSMQVCLRSDDPARCV